MLHYFIKSKDNNDILFFEDGTILCGSTEKLNFEVKKRESVLCSLKKDEVNKKRLKKLILLMTEDCNLRCRYCYLDYGNFNKNNEKHGFDIIKAKEIISQIYEEFDDGVESVIFFGGEPLISFSQIEILLEYIIQKCEENNVLIPEFGLITNGILLDKLKWEKLCQYHVKVKVSMDGEEYIHDMVRKDIAGNGTWNKLKSSVKERICENNEHIFFEMTLNRLHKKLLEDGGIEKCMQNFKDIGFFAGSIACTEFSKDPSLDFQKEDIEWLKELVSRITDYCFKEMEKDNSLFIIDIVQATLFILQKNLTDYHCYAGEKQYTITANGDILPCTAYAHSNVKISIKNKEFSLSDEVIKQHKCNKCWIHNFCRTFCYYRSKQRTEQNIDFDVRCVYVQAIYESVIRNVVNMYQNNKTGLLMNKLREYIKKI